MYVYVCDLFPRCITNILKYVVRIFLFDYLFVCARQWLSVVNDDDEKINEYLYRLFITLLF